ncbi:hypothetical protein [Hyphomicrobium sp.]|uniref:hypothetical protein n=1 Tax=Hyphomicrobium sp. TaxID=82 RepID=UPI002FE1E556
MARYTVLTQYVSGGDGDSGFDNLKDAEADFEDTTNDRTKVSVELWDNSGDEPTLIDSRTCE